MGVAFADYIGPFIPSADSFGMAESSSHIEFQCALIYCLILSQLLVESVSFEGVLTVSTEFQEVVLLTVLQIY
jgi:hypothetical protein